MTANKKKRVRVWTSEDRAAHRVFEKSRREAFNDGMIDLARQLPSLASARRLNKHLIVEHSVARHKAQKQLSLAAAHEFRELLAERDQLLVEVNRWRLASGAALPPREARPVGQQLRALLDVEHETFGTFPNGFGDNGGPEGSDEQDRDDTGYGTADDAIRTIDGVPVDECHGQYPPPISSIASNGHLGQITDPPPQNIPANSDASMFKYSDTIDLDFQSFGPPLSHGLSMVASEMPAEGYDIVSQPNQGNFNGTNGIDLQVPNLEHFPSIGLHNAVYEPFHQLQDPSLEHDTQIYQQAFPT